METVSRVRFYCELANARLRSTANIWDDGQKVVRPTTDVERETAIMDAWYYAMEARKASDVMTKTLLEYAKQNGLTIEQIDSHAFRR